VFADAGSLYDYKGPVYAPLIDQRVLLDDQNIVRTSVGVGLIWDSPFGPLRFDYAVPLTKGKNDRVQEFRFGGGTSF
jgi:outer membrane protein insertion porin family